MEYGHTPVLGKEAIEFLRPQPGATIIDATCGGGGHAELILRAIGPKGRLIGIDKDEDRLVSTGERLARYKKQLALVKADYKSIRLTLRKLNIERAHGVLFDLGVSSPQFDEPKRGFSYRFDAPLDMRMDLQQELNARTVINSYSKQDLTRIVRQYGEERWASRIAEFILKQRRIRPIETTFDLVEVIKAAIPASARRKGPHPARKTFQAIRIEVNDEIESLKYGLEEAIDILESKGRIVAISYHSLEDRIIKRTFKEQALPELGARLMILTKKPVRPSAEEVLKNPRSESAKLRAAEKL